MPYLTIIAAGTAAYVLFLSCGESRVFAAGMALAAAFTALRYTV